MDQRKHDESEFKMKFTKNRVIFILALTFMAIAVLFYQFFVPKPVTSIQYGDYTLYFRADLREATKISVYPSEGAIYNEMINSQVKNITIAFKPAGESENPYYILEIYELLYPKLPLAYSTQKMNVTFSREPIIVESYGNLTGTAENPVIALVHPVYSSGTSVSLEGHVITISGRSAVEFDQAVDKFLMVALGIKV